MEAIREKWAGIEYMSLWSMKRLAKDLGQPVPDGDALNNDESGNVRIPKEIVRAGAEDYVTLEERSRMMVDSKFVGKSFGKLHVLRFDHKAKGFRYYTCHCDKCGRDVILSNRDLSNPCRKSCGCLNGGGERKLRRSK